MKKTLFKNPKKFFVLLLPLLLIGGLLLASNEAENVLVKAAKEELLSILKSPSTAKFIGEPTIEKGFMRNDLPCGIMVDYDKNEIETNREKYFFTVTMTIDAQNSYGALIREDYTCTIYPYGTISCDEAEGFSELRETCDDLINIFN